MIDSKRLKKAFDELGVNPKLVEGAIGHLNEWLTDPKYEEYLPYIEHLYREEQYSVLLDSFCRTMPFGTAGRRGPVGVGPNRINPHTVTLSISGHCAYLKSIKGDLEGASVVLAFDVRQFHDLRGQFGDINGVLTMLSSKDLARFCAEVYGAHGIKVWIPDGLDKINYVDTYSGRFFSTPELSYLVRKLGADAGLNVSASHNHPDDNGCKFYNSQGSQELPPDDQILLDTVNSVTNIDTTPYEQLWEKDLIQVVPMELHQQYLEVNMGYCQTSSRSAKIAFSPLCGTGITTVGEGLDKLGFERVDVEGQDKYDGTFNEVQDHIGNPELPKALDKLEQTAIRMGCDLALATDPDADRLGMLVKSTRGDFEFVNGNEIGLVLLQSLLTARLRSTHSSGVSHKCPLFINTVVTSSLQREIAYRYNASVIGDLMVGFKYMGNVLNQLDQYGRFPKDKNTLGMHQVEGASADMVLACEEAHGYLICPEIRDKDACGASLHLAGLASDLKDKNRTIIDYLDAIYGVYGYCKSVQNAIVFEGVEGRSKMDDIINRLRDVPLREIEDYPVKRAADHRQVGGPICSETDRASRNILVYELDLGFKNPGRVIVRPSGTEPKVKVYVEVFGDSEFRGNLDEYVEAHNDMWDHAGTKTARDRIDSIANGLVNAFASRFSAH